MRRVTRLLGNWGRLIFVLAVLLSAFSFAMFQGGFVSWFIFYMILPFVVYSILLAVYPLKSIEWRREVGETRLRRGDSLTTTVRLSRRFPFPLLYTTLAERSEAGSGQKMVMIGFRKQARWAFQQENMPRGEYVMEGIEVETADFFGWVRKNHFVPMPQRVLVYPRVEEIAYQPIDIRYDQGVSAAPYTFVKDTSMVSGIRDYQPGDRFSWIHWKSFARTQTMQTKEFETRQSQDLVILDDRQHSSKFELQVDLVASLIRSVVRSGSSLVYLSAGKKVDFFPSVRSEGDYEQVLEFLAKLQPDTDELRTEVISRRLQQLQPPLLLYVTGRLTDGMVTAILRSSSRMTCVCLVVTEKGEKLPPEQQSVHDAAAAKGILVKSVRREDFANVFKEVNRL